MKKRVISLLLAALILVGTLPIVTASALIGPQYVSTANHKGLNMRTGPSKNFAVIMSIPYGAQVSSYEYYDNSWAYVTYNGQAGYCMSRYFSSTKPSGQPAPSPSPSGSTDVFKGFVKANYYVTVRPSTPSGYVNLRWAPSKTYAIESTYYAGYMLHVIAKNGTWAQVYDANTDTCGFMMLSFLTETAVGEF